MQKELLFMALWTLTTGAVALLVWMVLGNLLRRLKENQARQAPDPLGLIDTQAEERRQTETAEAGVRVTAACLIATPVLFALSYGLLGLTAANALGAAAWAFAVVGILLTGFAFLRHKSALLGRRDIRWYHEAKAMVDRAIAPLIPRGYVVFRDFKADEMSIDHLLVGPKGIFALQTIVRPTSHKEGPAAIATATYDGRTLFFPHGEEHTSVEKAEKNAEMISDWISKRLNIPIAARAIVALPGWQVKRTSSQGISVINPGQMEALFQYIRPWPLTEDILLQVVRLMENHQGNIRHISIESVAGEGLAR